MTEKRRFRHWAYLNEKGRKLYGEIFPDGQVPLLSMIPQMAQLGGSEPPQRVQEQGLIILVSFFPTIISKKTGKRRSGTRKMRNGIQNHARWVASAREPRNATSATGLNTVQR